MKKFGKKTFDTRHKKQYNEYTNREQLFNNSSVSQLKKPYMLEIQYLTMRRRTYKIKCEKREYYQYNKSKKCANIQRGEKKNESPKKKCGKP